MCEIPRECSSNRFNKDAYQRISLFPVLEVRYILRSQYWNVKLRILLQKNVLFTFEQQADALYVR
jgi:hypothetical protein